MTDVTLEMLPAITASLTQRVIADIEAATTIDDAKKIFDQWNNIEAFARAAKQTELKLTAEELKLRAERKLGLLMKAQKETFGLNKGGRPNKTGSSEDPVLLKPTLTEVGIDKHLADRARKL